MITGDSSYCALIMEDRQYFAIPEFVNISNGYFVDAGAYVGDTVEEFIWVTSGIFMKVYAFEPGKTQFIAMKNRIDRLCREWAIPKSAIICEYSGLANDNKDLSLNESKIHANMSMNFQSTIANSKTNINVNCYSLDSYLAGQPATFIKADIEGMELEMLSGASKTIREFKPKMAISIYHNPYHFYKIAEYINSLLPEYSMAVRHHSPSLSETVLYCWVPQN